MTRLRIFVLAVLVLGLLSCAAPGGRHVKKGHKYLGSGQLEKAEREFQKAIKKDPQNSKAHFGLGYVLFRKNEFDRALAAYKQGVDIDPNDPDSHYYLALIYNEKNMQKEARDEFKLHDKLRRSSRH